MNEPLNLGPYPTAEVLLQATLGVLKDEQTRMAGRVKALLELYPDADKNDPNWQGAVDWRMSETYGVTAAALDLLILEHSRRITRATNPNFAKLSDEEIDTINAGFANY